MTKTRGFEVISKEINSEINLPVRATRNAAGYDFQASEDIVIQPVWKAFLKEGAKSLPALLKSLSSNKTKEELDQIKKALKPVLVPTAIKSYMGENEYLQLANRSSNPLKRFLVLANGVGVIDSDYYNNDGNEGHIMFQFLNFGLTAVTIKKGENIGQGVFLPFLKADNDVAGGDREGGFGSTGK